MKKSVCLLGVLLMLCAALFAFAGCDMGGSASIVGATVNQDGVLLITLANGEVIEAGVILGEDGLDGLNGTDGKSAYELYLEHHPDYAGDEETWLEDLANGSLKKQEATYGLEYYLLADGTLGVAIGTAGYAETIVIPAVHDGYTVTKIMDEGFAGNTNVKEIVLPDTITDIGTYAFRCCLNLERMELPESVTSVGVGAFDYCVKWNTAAEDPNGGTSGAEDGETVLDGAEP